MTSPDECQGPTEQDAKELLQKLDRQKILKQEESKLIKKWRNEIEKGYYNHVPPYRKTKSDDKTIEVLVEWLQEVDFSDQKKEVKEEGRFSDEINNREKALEKLFSWLREDNPKAVLDWSNLGLTGLPKSIPDWVRRINISENNLSSLVLSDYPQLKEINAARSLSKDVELPDAFFENMAGDIVKNNAAGRLAFPESIETLDISGNKITDMNQLENLKNCHFLKELNISDNPLENLTGEDLEEDDLISIDILPQSIETLYASKPLLDAWSQDPLTKERASSGTIHSEGNSAWWSKNIKV